MKHGDLSKSNTPITDLRLKWKKIFDFPSLALPYKKPTFCRLFVVWNVNKPTNK